MLRLTEDPDLEVLDFAIIHLLLPIRSGEKDSSANSSVLKSRKES